MSYDFGSEPVRATCPHCEVRMTTKISTKTPMSTHLNACFMFICFFPLAWLPYCVSKEIIEHRCSRCDELLGTVNPSSSDCTICNWCYEGDSYDEVITHDGSHYIYYEGNYFHDYRHLYTMGGSDLNTAVEESGAVDASICFIV